MKHESGKKEITSVIYYAIGVFYYFICAHLFLKILFDTGFLEFKYKLLDLFNQTQNYSVTAKIDSVKLLRTNDDSLSLMSCSSLIKKTNKSLMALDDLSVHPSATTVRIPYLIWRTSLSNLNASRATHYESGALLRLQG